MQIFFFIKKNITYFFLNQLCSLPNTKKGNHVFDEEMWIGHLAEAEYGVESYFSKSIRKSVLRSAPTQERTSLQRTPFLFSL